MNYIRTLFALVALANMGCIQGMEKQALSSRLKKISIAEAAAERKNTAIAALLALQDKPTSVSPTPVTISSTYNNCTINMIMPPLPPYLTYNPAGAPSLTQGMWDQFVGGPAYSNNSVQQLPVQKPMIKKPRAIERCEKEAEHNAQVHTATSASSMQQGMIIETPHAITSIPADYQIGFVPKRKCASVLFRKSQEADFDSWKTGYEENRRKIAKNRFKIAREDSKCEVAPKGRIGNYEHYSHEFEEPENPRVVSFFNPRATWQFINESNNDH